MKETLMITGTQQVVGEEAIKVEEFESKNLHDIVMPIWVKVLESMLRRTGYEESKINHLIKGFSEGFDLGYRGPQNCADYSKNLPFTIGTPTEMWNKIMKEVKLHRYAGPFESIPYEYFIQSLIRLVPKDNGKKTRLIFHLSFDFQRKNWEEMPNSVNFFTPKQLCSVKYKDLDYAVRVCLNLQEKLRQGKWDHLLENEQEEVGKMYFSKTDAVSAFRRLPISPHQ